MQRTILCYGDSNTWGYVPTNSFSTPLKRYPRAERWPGALQNLLGEDYYVVEEGLNGRTTNLDYHIPPNRNGKAYLPSCLYTHAPIDLVILALGGNDLKVYFNRTAEQICDGVLDLVDIIQTSVYGYDFQSAPEILLVSPPLLSPMIEQFRDENGMILFEGAIKKVNLLIDLCSKLAKEKNCYYLDISNSVSPSTIDGLHFDAPAHKKIAQLMHEKIKRIYEMVS